MLYNESHVRQYLKDTAPQVGQIGKDFWPALEVRIRQILDQAVRINRNHSRITGGELLAYNARAEGYIGGSGKLN